MLDCFLEASSKLSLAVHWCCWGIGNGHGLGELVEQYRVSTRANRLSTERQNQVVNGENLIEMSKY